MRYLMGVPEVFDGCPGYFERCPGDILSVFWRYLMGLLGDI